MEPVFQGLYGNLYQKLIASITARNPPALAQMYESWTTRLYDRDRLEPVQNYIDGPQGYSPDELGDFYPAFLTDNRWNETLVTMPLNKSAYVLQYNVDLLERAGIAAPPKTWEALRQAAQAISRLKTEEGLPCWGLLIRPQMESFTTLFFTAGGMFLDSEGRPQMQSEPSRRALRFLTELTYSDHAAIVDSNYPATLFGTGRLGMFIYSSAAFPFNDRTSAGKFKWRAAPIPAPADVPPDIHRTLFQGMNIGILKDNPQGIREAAWSFIKFMLEPERAAAWSMQTGYCPLRKSCMEVPAFREYVTSHPNFAVTIGEIERAGFEPKPDFWESWRSDVGDEIVNALQGIKSPEDALAAAQKDGEDSLKYDSKFPFTPGER